MLEPGYPLVTAKLTLRPFEVTDLEAFHDMYGREDVTRYLPWAAMDLDAARLKLAQRVRQTRIATERDAIVLAAVETATGRMIGELMLSLTSAESRQGMVGWALHPDAHGRGLATEGAREMLRLGFDELELHRIAAECDPRNDASIRVMERLGMRREAHLLENEYLKGEWVGSLICALLEDEWRELSRPPARS